MMIRGTVLIVAHLNEPVIYLGEGICRRGLWGCRQRILWARTANNRPIALNPAANEHGYYVAHQATCPDRERFRTAARR